MNYKLNIYRLFCICFILHTSLQRSIGQELPLETVVQTGHYEAITTLAFSSDGKLLVSGSQDRTAKLWELSTGRELRTFTGSINGISDLAISPDNKFIITVDMDSSARLWNLNSGALIHRFKPADDFINNALFTGDGKHLITGGKTHNATIWDLETKTISYQLTGEKIGCYAGECKVSLALSPDEKYLLTGIGDRTAILWNLKKGEEIFRVKGGKGSCSSCMTSVAFSPDGKTFITGASRDSVRIWSTGNGRMISAFPAKRGFSRVGFGIRGNYFSGLEQHVFRYYDLKTGVPVFEFGSYGNEINAFSQSSQLVALGGRDKTIRIIDVRSHKTIKTFSGLVNAFEDSLKQNIRTWVKNINAEMVSPDGKYVARGKMGNIARLWDINTGRIVRDFIGHKATVIDLAFSPDGKHLATASADGTAGVWNLETGERIHHLKYHADVLFSVAYSRDGTKLATGGWDGLVVTWDSATGRPTGRYKPHGNSAPVEVSFTPNGLYLITGGLDQKLLMTELDTGLPVREFIGHRHHVVSLDYSPDGKYLLSGSWDGLAKLWDLNTGLLAARYGGHDREIYDVAFSPDGNMVATASGDKTARIWETFTGKEVMSFSGHNGAVTAVNFRMGTNQLFTAGRDGATKSWDIDHGLELFTHIFTGEKDWLVKVPDGKFYATDGARKSVFFVRGTESYNIERFYDEYYSPGLLNNLGKPATRDAGGMGLIDKLKQYPPPIIEIMSPKPPYPEGVKKVELMMRITNTGGGVEEIKVLQNGKRIIDDREDLEKINKKGKSIVKIYEVSLVPGFNDISVSAFSQGRIESRVQNLNITIPGDLPIANCYILAIGINAYKNPALNLNYARDDAEAFVAELKKRTKKLYRDILVHDLYDEDATRENILQQLGEIKKDIGPNDVFFFFYAGHGSIVNNIFYFIPTDNTRLYEQEALQAEALSADTLQAQFRQIKALKQVMVIDACHSGGSTALLAERGAAEEKALAQLSRSAGIHVLAAAGSEQTAAEFKELGHGLFTYMILEAFSGRADGAPLDNKITVYELKSFLDDQVPEYSRKYKGSPQFPSTFSRGHDFPLILD
ncbi:MAG: caspase family protein [Cyclobacteriaceae bacterium]|nr:caspase family protein [Cyclobacteriaceae bacterium]